MSGTTAMPLVLLAISPKTEADHRKLDQALQQLMAEDSTFRVQTDPRTGQITLASIGESELEVIVDRLAREFKVAAAVGRPHVAYKEACTRAANGDGRYVRQTGGLGQYGHAKIRLLPGEPGTGYVFQNGLIRSALPDQFIKPIDEGIQEACTRGVLAGYPIDDVRIELYDGSYHQSDSSEMAFRMAGAMAFHDAAKKAGLVLLEPMMRVEVVVPTEHTGDVIRNFLDRRGQIQSDNDRGDTHVIQAHVPLAEMFGYATDLESHTRGRATYTLAFDRYQVCDPRGGDGDRDSLVTSPLRPMPRLDDSAIALPEPDDDRSET